MQNDLISRSALLKDIGNSITEYSGTYEWFNVIGRQDKAYDIEKVVELLTDYLAPIVGKKSGLYNEVIKIVRSGGKG